MRREMEAFGKVYNVRVLDPLNDDADFELLDDIYKALQVLGKKVKPGMDKKDIPTDALDEGMEWNRRILNEFTGLDIKEGDPIGIRETKLAKDILEEVINPLIESIFEKKKNVPRS